MKNIQNFTVPSLKCFIDRNCYWLLLLIPATLMIMFMIYASKVDRVWLELEYLINVTSNSEDKLRFAEYTLQRTFLFNWFKLISEPLMLLILELLALLIVSFSFNILLSLNITMRQTIGNIILYKIPYLIILLMVSINLSLSSSPLRAMPESLNPFTLNNLFFNVDEKSHYFSFFTYTDFSIVLGIIICAIFIRKTIKTTRLLSVLAATLPVATLTASRFLII